MTTTIQHQGKTWYLAFAWISRDVRRGSDPRERLRLGLHPGDGPGSDWNFENMIGIDLEWTEDEWPYVNFPLADTWPLLPQMISLLQYLFECCERDNESLPQWVVDYLTSVGYADLTHYAHDAELDAITETVARLSEHRLTYLQRALTKQGYVLSREDTQTDETK